MRNCDLFSTLKVKEGRKKLKLSIHPSFPYINPLPQHGYLTCPTQKILNFEFCYFRRTFTWSIFGSGVIPKVERKG